MDVSISLRLPLFPRHLEPPPAQLLLSVYQPRPSHFRIALMAHLVVITARNAVQQTNTALHLDQNNPDNYYHDGVFDFSYDRPAITTTWSTFECQHRLRTKLFVHHTGRVARENQRHALQP